MRVAILISGGGSNMVALVRSMTGEHPARPCLVLSNDPSCEGLKRAEELGVPTAAIDHRPFGTDRRAFEAFVEDVLRPAAPDLICLAGFMRILTPDFVEHWCGRLLNIHPSLLPLYPGLHTHKRALEAGDEEAGCTVHEVTATLDSGPILGQARVPVLNDDTVETLAERVLLQEHILYPAVLARVASGNRRPLYLPSTR